MNDRLYRGGQPTAVGLEELGAMGVKRVISLCTKQETTGFEEEQLNRLGIKFIHIPLGEFSAPSNGQIQTILKLLMDNSGPTFVHCRRGKDRTGTVIACYRIQHDGWDNRRAFEEAKAHGMSSFERGMQSYVIHFSPLQITPTRPAGQ